MSVKLLTIKEDILEANEQKAKTNRELMDKHHILMLDVTSSPGSGKTSLILQTANKLRGKTRLAVIEGDIASTIDADKVSKLGVPVVQINTAGACHLDASMIDKALHNLPLDDVDLIMIENVGNLICTADFALGAHRNVMLLSVPEGDDKPHKYPLMFSGAHVVLVNKIDVMPYFDFDIEAFTKAVTGLNPAAKIMPVSAKTGEGLEAWYSWLEDELHQKAGVA